VLQSPLFLVIPIFFIDHVDQDCKSAWTAHFCLVSQLPQWTVTVWQSLCTESANFNQFKQWFILWIDPLSIGVRALSESSVFPFNGAKMTVAWQACRIVKIYRVLITGAWITLLALTQGLLSGHIYKGFFMSLQIHAYVPPQTIEKQSENLCFREPINWSGVSQSAFHSAPHSAVTGPVDIHTFSR
jgi:hypothetical protein